VIETWRDAIDMAERSVLGHGPAPELQPWIARELRRPEVEIDLPPDGIVYLAVLLDFLSIGETGQAILHAGDSAAQRNIRALLSAARGRYSEALEELETALLSPDSLALRSRILVNLATVSLRSGDLAAAERRLASAESVRTTADDPALDVALASTRAGIARARCDGVALKAAADTLAEASRRRIPQLERGHPQTFLLLADLATVELELARMDSSASKLEQVVMALDAAAWGIAATFGRRHPQTLTVRANLCAAELDLAFADGSAERVEQAAAGLRMTYEDISEVLGATHPQTLLMSANVAAAELELAQVRGEPAMARRVAGELQGAVDRITQAVGVGHPNAVLMLVNLASAQLELAYAERSSEELDRAMSALHVAADRAAMTFTADHAVSALIRRELQAAQALASGGTMPQRSGGGRSLAARTTAIEGWTFGARYIPFHEAAERATSSDFFSAAEVSRRRAPQVAVNDMNTFRKGQVGKGVGSTIVDFGHGVSRGGFWHELSESERTALHAAGRTREYATGTLLSSQGADPDHVLIILEGWVKVTAGRADGHEVMLAIRGPADTIGESGWLNGRPRSANVKALNRVRALAVPAEQFANFLNGHAHAAQMLARVMVGRMDDADRRMTSQVGTSGPKLLALLLLDLAERYGVPGPEGSVALPLPLTQHELATMIGRARETVARALTVWRKDGLVATQRMRILITDADALREVAETEDG